MVKQSLTNENLSLCLSKPSKKKVYSCVFIVVLDQAQKVEYFCFSEWLQSLEYNVARI